MMKVLWSKRRRCLAVSTASMLIMMMGCAAATFSQTQLVTIEPRPGVTQQFMLITPDNPMAAVVLFEGGTGTIGLSGFQSNPQIQGAQGFLARNRNNFARHGLMVALVDAPSDAGSRGITPMFRMSLQHAQDIEKMISRLRQEANIPVWLIGISLGNYSSVNAAVYAKDTIDGLVLASAATRSEPNSRSASVTPNGILGMELEAIVVPTLIVFHEDDACYGTPASGAPKIQAELTNAPEVSVQYFTGGKTPASQREKQSFSSGKRKPRTSGARQSGSPGRKKTASAGERQAPPQECGTRAPHTFDGIDDEVVAAIAGFIKSHSQ